MSKQTAKPYSAEFKERAVKLAVESDQPVAQTARDLGVNENTLHTWLSKYHHGSQGAQEQLNSEHLYEELKRLKKENALLKEERDILKKAAAYFAVHSR
jgi:transposase